MIKWKIDRLIFLEDKVYMDIQEFEETENQVKSLWNSSTDGLVGRPNKLNFLKSLLQKDEEVLIELPRKLLDLVNELVSWWELEQELQTEKEAHQEAIRVSQQWHERQKREITEAKDRIIEEWKTKHTNFLNSRKAKITQELTLLRNLLNHE